MNKQTQFIIDAYTSLLRVTDWKWRSANQKIYCDLRNKIADDLGISHVDVQDEYENKAMLLNHAEKHGLKSVSVGDTNQSIHRFD